MYDVFKEVVHLHKSILHRRPSVPKHYLKELPCRHVRHKHISNRCTWYSLSLWYLWAYYTDDLVYPSTIYRNCHVDTSGTNIFPTDAHGIPWGCDTSGQQQVSKTNSSVYIVYRLAYRMNYTWRWCCPLLVQVRAESTGSTSDHRNRNRSTAEMLTCPESPQNPAVSGSD